MASDPGPLVSSEPPRPAVNAMLLCERILREQGTGRVTLVGILDRVTSPQFPFEYVCGMGVYLRMTDAAGRYLMHLDQIRLEDQTRVGRWELTAAVANPISAYEVTLQLPRVSFERRGAYEFRFSVHGRFVAGAILSLTSEEEGGWS
jgi:hypothetical protein